MLCFGHVIGEDGVRVHQEKIRAILDSPTPKNMTELRGFMGIFTYYRRFVKGFSQLATPLTTLTKKGAFEWTDGAQEAFECLKWVMSSHVLSLPYFSRSFVLECDASEETIGAVLSQEGHLIAFESRKLQRCERLYSIYDK